MDYHLNYNYIDKLQEVSYHDYQWITLKYTVVQY